MNPCEIGIPDVAPTYLFAVSPAVLPDSNLGIPENFHFSSHRTTINYVIEQDTPILSLACSVSHALAVGTELTNHQASVFIW